MPVHIVKLYFKQIFHDNSGQLHERFLLEFRITTTEVHLA